MLQWSQTTCALKSKLWGRENGRRVWAVDYFSLLGIPPIFLKSSCVRGDPELTHPPVTAQLWSSLSCVEYGVPVSCTAQVRAQLRSGQCGWSVGLRCLEVTLPPLAVTLGSIFWRIQWGWGQHKVVRLEPQTCGRASRRRVWREGVSAARVPLHGRLQTWSAGCGPHYQRIHSSLVVKKS